MEFNISQDLKKMTKLKDMNILKENFSKTNFINSLLLPIFLVLLNFIVKGIYISNNSIAGDEPFSIYIAQLDIISIIEQLSTGNNPPLYEILLHFWIKLFGISEFSVRMPSLLFSCITLIFLFKIGISFFNKRIALYVSLIFIFSNYHIIFAHEARVYALMGMLSTISIFYYLKIITLNKSNKWHFYLLILANILLIYSHYFGVFVLLVISIHFIMNKEMRNKYFKHFFLSIGILIFLYLPNVLVVFNRFIDSSVNGTWIQPPSGFESIYNMLWSFSNAPVVTVSVVVVLLSALIKTLVKRKIVKSNIIANKLIIIWFVFTFFFMFFISYWIPVFFDRYLMSVSISFCLLVAIASDYLIDKKYVKYIIPSLVCLMFIVTAKPNITNKRNVNETIGKLKELKSEENVIVYFSPSWYDLNFIYYYDNDVFRNYNNKNLKSNIHKYFDENNIYPINNVSQIEMNLLKGKDKIVYLDAGANFSFPNNNILNLLENKLVLKNKYEYYEIFKIYEFRN